MILILYDLGKDMRCALLERFTKYFLSSEIIVLNSVAVDKHDIVQKTVH